MALNPTVHQDHPGALRSHQCLGLLSPESQLDGLERGPGTSGHSWVKAVRAICQAPELCSPGLTRFQRAACLVKSVFKAPVPAYCLAQAFALSAQAVEGGKKEKSVNNH